MQNTIDKKESNFFSIRSCFLARHSDDSSITTPIDDMGIIAKNANGGPSNTFSRHQKSSCFTNEQGYGATYSFRAPSFRFVLKVQKYPLKHKVQTLMAPSILTLQFGIYQCLFVLYFLFPATDRSISKPLPAMNRELQ